MEINASKSLYNGGRLTLGFYIDEDKHYQIDQQGAHTVRTIFEMYVKDSTMADIINYLNKTHVKTGRGNEFSKNSIRKILTNKRYIGYYVYDDVELKDAVPRIISDELFEQAQQKLSQNKKAPARAKAKENYLLTTRLFCGLCGNPMVGSSGTSRNKNIYNYYICRTAPDEKCCRKPVSKSYIEDLVVSETKKLLTDKKIDIIAKEVVDLCKRDSNTPEIQRIKRLVRDGEKGLENLIKALEQGKAVDIITDSIVKKQAEIAELKKQLSQESIKYPQLTVEQVKFFMNKFKTGDVNDMKFRKSLTNTFVRKIVLDEDKMTILYNIQDGQSSVPFKDSGSYKGTMVEHSGIEPLTSALRTQRSTS